MLTAYDNLLYTKTALNVKQSMWLTHWGRVPHICVNKLTMIVSDNCLSPGRRQAVMWSNPGIFFNGTNLRDISIKIHIFFHSRLHALNALKYVVCEIAAILSRLQCVNQGNKKTTCLHSYIQWYREIPCGLVKESYNFLQDNQNRLPIAMMTSSNGNIFRVTGLLYIYRFPVNSPHKGQSRGLWCFSSICARINGWVNNGKAGDLRRHRAHYDVTIMAHSWGWGSFLRESSISLESLQ